MGSSEKAEGLSDGVKRIVVVGAGRAGTSIARLLTGDGRYSVAFVEPVEEAQKQARSEGYEVLEGSGTDLKFMERALDGTTAAVVAAPDSVAPPTARSARVARCHYLDLSENSALAEEIAEIAEGAPRAFVPGCGLAPGYVSTLVNDMIRQCGTDAEIGVYVGVLPTHQINRLGYGKMWSIEGLVTEYTNPCKAIVSGIRTKVPPLTGFETLTIGGTAYEAFTTAGSIDGLVDKLEGSVRSLVFKTLRYPGHLDYMKLLIDDLGLGSRRDFLKNLLYNGLPVVETDEVILSITARFSGGASDEKWIHERAHTQRIHSTRLTRERTESAVSRATAAHACSVIDLLCAGVADHAGLLHPEEIDSGSLAESPFFEPLVPKSGDLSNGESSRFS